MFVHARSVSAHGFPVEPAPVVAWAWSPISSADISQLVAQDTQVLMYMYMYIYIINIHIYISSCGSNPHVVAAPSPPLLQAFVLAGCFKPFVVDFSRLCLNIFVQGSALFLGVYRGGVCRKTPPSVTNLCGEMPA